MKNYANIYQLERVFSLKNWFVFHKIKLLAAATIIVLGVLFIFYNKSEQNELLIGDTLPPVMNAGQLENKEAEVEKMIIMVDIKGAVKNPGVYQAVEGERIYDLVNKAGGFAGGADQNQVNLSQRVVDEMVIYVPLVGVEGEGTPLEIGQGQSKFVNINKASESELQTLPGIGPAKALAILEFREANGGFKTIEDLKKISGIGEKTFEKLAPLISVK
jgi:competence protein ComEA